MTVSKGSKSPSKSSPFSGFERFRDKALQYLLDGDSALDGSTDDIWLMGVCHPGTSTLPIEASPSGRRHSFRKRNSTDSLASRLSSTSSAGSPSSPGLLLQVTHGWPVQFYVDFYTRVALTYRTAFPPIPCSPPAPTGAVQGVLNSLSMSIGRGSNGRTAEGLTSDSGWGCMLRTGQSLLANALVHVHLGRDWRRSLPPLPPPVPKGGQKQVPQYSPPPLPLSSPPEEAQHALYARLISLFLDTPSSVSPFSVHRFALMGKSLGKQVGEWFGPSTAAGAIKALVNEYEPAGIGVASCMDGVVYRADVENAARAKDGKWERPVLVLINVRLGIDGVNPIYHESIKALFRLPQSVGIAGGRPSSSYYFVGSQAESLFYIDPHHPRPTVSPQIPPSREVEDLCQTTPMAASPSHSSPRSVQSSPRQRREGNMHAKRPSADGNIGDSLGTLVPSSPSSIRSPARSSTTARMSKLDAYFSTSCSDAQLRTYHCDKVRKMPLSSLDPSMLLGFVIRDEDDWREFAKLVKEGARESGRKSIFFVEEEKPAWLAKREFSATAGPGAASPKQAQSNGGPGMNRVYEGESEESLGSSGMDVESLSEPEDWDWPEQEAPSAATGLAPAADVKGKGKAREVLDEDDDWVKDDKLSSTLPLSAVPPPVAFPTGPPSSTRSALAPAPEPEDEDDGFMTVPAPDGASLRRSSPSPVHVERPGSLLTLPLTNDLASLPPLPVTPDSSIYVPPPSPPLPAAARPPPPLVRDSELVFVPSDTPTIVNGGTTVPLSPPPATNSHANKREPSADDDEVGNETLRA